MVSPHQQLILPGVLPDVLAPTPVTGNTFSQGGVTIAYADALHLYSTWNTPTVIISDGAYGLSAFEGDPHSPDSLTEWYEPHVEAWSLHAAPRTTLWFWNTEIGWATVHPLLQRYGWKYVNCHVWDKGIGHVAGNSNTKTLRKFPVVTELCVQYVREVRVNGLTLQQWLRSEWERTGLPLSKANAACGVSNAATRKYLTKDHLWYFPPPELFAKLVAYANQYGAPVGKPYFSLDKRQPATADEWAKMRAPFTCKHGITNVWKQPPLNGTERLKIGSKSIHLNQKPQNLLELIIEASSEPGDVVWEPFGGLCTGALACYRLNRRCLSAEIQREFFELAVRRLRVIE